METRINYAAVGLFILLLATMWVAASIWLMFGNPTANYQQYVVYMEESVSGLVRDAAVRYRGVDVGKVNDIRLRPGNPEQVMVVLDIRKDAPIRTDTKATLRSQGLTGLYFVELVGGSKEAPMLEPGADGKPAVLEAVPSLFMRLDQTVTSLLDNLTRVSGRVEMLLSDDNMQSLEVTLANVAEVTETVAASRADIDAAITDARRSMAEFRRLTSGLADRQEQIQGAIGNFANASENVAEFSRALPRLMEEVEAVAAELRAASEKLASVADNTDAALGKINDSTITDINQAVYQLRHTLDSLEQLSSKLRSQPSMLIYGEPQRPLGPGEGG